MWWMVDLAHPAHLCTTLQFLRESGDERSRTCFKVRPVRGAASRQLAPAKLHLLPRPCKSVSSATVDLCQSLTPGSTGPGPALLPQKQCFSVNR